MIKKFILIITICALTFLFSKGVSAHTIGQPPFFKINGIYSALYPVQSTSLETFELPQDSSPDTYLINETIHFEIDTQALQVPDEIIKQTEFTWDLGDGGKATGLQNSYAYKKMGSYILKIYAKTRQDASSQLFQSVVLNIVPDKSYKLPKAVIKVNDWISRDPVNDIAKVPFGEVLGFDASQSTDSSKITSYFWDFGDGASSENQKITHTYAKDLTLVFPVLRIKDENGFFADTNVQINNQDLTNETVAHPIGKYGSFSNNLKILIPVGVVLLVFIFVIAMTSIKKK